MLDATQIATNQNGKYHSAIRSALRGSNPTNQPEPKPQLKPNPINTTPKPTETHDEPEAAFGLPVGLGARLLVGKLGQWLQGEAEEDPHRARAQAGVHQEARLLSGDEESARHQAQDSSGAQANHSEEDQNGSGLQKGAHHQGSQSARYQEGSISGSGAQNQGKSNRPSHESVIIDRDAPSIRSNPLSLTQFFSIAARQISSIHQGEETQVNGNAGRTRHDSASRKDVIATLPLDRSSSKRKCNCQANENRLRRINFTASRT